MATRPVFFVKTEKPFYGEETVSFQFNPGFSVGQKQKNIRNIHDAFLKRHRNARVLEISSKSDVPIGVQLSAFNLPVAIEGIQTTVESAFQSSKVFERGGPYTDLLTLPSHMAKKDPRLSESGPLRQFCLSGHAFPLVPKTFFYDWLYISAVAADEKLSEQLCQYDAFTDIEFNPEKSINCQARSAAIFVAISKIGMLPELLTDPAQFREFIYEDRNTAGNQQLKLF